MSEIDKIMSQAQVFASARSLVGGRFDNGSALDEADEMVRCWRALLPSGGG